jgi:hypothetical protein
MKKIANALGCLIGSLGFAALVFLYETRDRSTEEEEDYSFFQEG